LLNVTTISNQVGSLIFHSAFLLSLAQRLLW
jgi:hypothetical protein